MEKRESMHTPGPWRAFKEHPNNPWWAIGCDSRDVADVHESKTVAWNNPKAQNEVEANARLIAAAPDLLAALKDCLEARKWLRLAKGEPIGRAVVVEDVFARAAEIVAKAEGREP